VIVTEDIELGSNAPPGDEERFLSYLADPTFLNYSFSDPNSLSGLGGVLDLDDLINYNSLIAIEITVNLGDFIGEYELGKRDIAGGCLDLPQQKDIDDVC
jgi:hypothetical protein